MSEIAQNYRLTCAEHGYTVDYGSLVDAKTEQRRHELMMHTPVGETIEPNELDNLPSGTILVDAEGREWFVHAPRTVICLKNGARPASSDELSDPFEIVYVP